MGAEWGHFLDPQLFFELILVALYIYTLHVLIWSKNDVFRSAFYVIFLIGGLFDITMAIACIFLRLNESIGFCDSWEPVLRLASTCTGFNFMVHIFLNLLMTLNRFTAVCWPIDHKRIWHSHIYIPVVTSLILISLAIFGIFFFIPLRLELKEENFCVITGRVLNEGKYAHMATGVAVVVFEALTLIMSPITIYKMMKLKSKLRQGGSKQEASLAFFSLIKCASFSVELVYELAKMLGIDITHSWVMSFIIQQFTTYFFFLVVFNGPSLFLLSSTLRRDTISRWRKTQVHNVSTHSTPSQNTQKILSVHHSAVAPTRVK